MNRINVLSEALANRIAAGEVVERPASIVKELVENAVDAEATRVEVELAEGGRKLIRVSDDGLGMSPEDAALCVQRFATSKVSEESDLQHIETMGFRGEALPSIASVSHLRITTRLRESDEGTMLTIEGGDITEVRAVGCPTGTTIEVANLFYNTPARLKFLRTTGTERGHCTDWVTRMALARPDVAMQVTHEGTVLLSSPGRGDLPATVAQILGSTVARQMLMLPMTLELTDAEQVAVDEHREALGEAGFEIEPFGGSGYLVRSVPASLAERGPEEALRGIIEELAEWGKSDQGDARERLIATIACHGAIKSGEHLSEREMRHLIRQLNRSSTPAICPHGDPIIVSISRAELDRRFGRSYRDSE